MQIYLAGPDVFRPDALERAASARRLLERHGYRALLPLDNEISDAVGICRANVQMIVAADLVIADLNPFRGFEPDSGTVYEVGYACALGKPVIAYVADDRPLATRLSDHLGHRLRECDGQLRDDDGLSVENHGLALNLMLAASVRLVRGGLPEALASLAAGHLSDQRVTQPPQTGKT